ncbi:hypothetical protein LWC34_44305 [Kibdelosporangium philippinense]|uniref:DUF6545 domain-containing protein n=1 Tax=Kibdelosporangium philippinense TaxID=211113 RepID=A0ABS8ZPW1_9PSEU|nr:MAB_1171c family putative transporter [Kibdelosporangium philippinense]MCE7009788.1 hypothetical protein [Kibdelosporangium philippinense]
MVDYVKYAVGVLCLVIAVFKARQGTVNTAARYAVACFALLGLAAFAIAPGTLRLIHTFEPLPNFGRWIGNGLVIVAGWCVIAILAYTVREGARARRLVVLHGVIAGLVVLAMGVLLFAGDTQFEIEFVTVYGNRPTIAAYLTLFSAYCAAGLGAFVALIRRYSAAATDRALRVGLNIMMLGAFAGLLWALWKTVVLVINRLSASPVAAEAEVTALLSSTAAALIAVGGVVPLVARPIRRARTARRLRALEPLWSELHGVLPEIKLAVDDDDFGVYRRVIEIRDANLALRAYCHPEVRAWATEAAQQRGITGDQIEVLVEAAVTASAIEAHAAGVRYHPDPRTAESPNAGTGDINAERDWLIRVSQAFAKDPTVRDIRERVRTEVTSTAARPVPPT